VKRGSSDRFSRGKRVDEPQGFEGTKEAFRKEMQVGNRKYN